MAEQSWKIESFEYYKPCSHRNIVELFKEALQDTPVNLLLERHSDLKKDLIVYK